MKDGSRNWHTKRRTKRRKARKGSYRPRAKRLKRLRAKSHTRVRRSRKAPNGLTYRQLQAALREMARGKSLGESAQEVGMPVGRLRRLLSKEKLIKRVKGGWALAPGRHRRIRMYSEGKIIDVLVGARTASRIGTYLAAVKAFLRDQNLAHLAPFVGKSIKEVDGTKHPFEMRPGELYRLDNTEGDPFEEMYAFVF